MSQKRAFSDTKELPSRLGFQKYKAHSKIVCSQPPICLSTCTRENVEEYSREGTKAEWSGVSCCRRGLSVLESIAKLECRLVLGRGMRQLREDEKRAQKEQTQDESEQTEYPRRGAKIPPNASFMATLGAWKTILTFSVVLFPHIMSTAQYGKHWSAF